MGKIIKVKKVKNNLYEIVRYIKNGKFVFTIRVINLFTAQKIELEYDDQVFEIFDEMTTFTYTENVA